MQTDISDILRQFDPAAFDPAQYARFKRQIAAAIQPHDICEIGIGMGVAALAFLEVSPFGVTYTGIDNDYEYGRKFSVRPSEHVSRLLGEHGYHSEIIVADSQTLTELPSRWYDLVHIDGDHSAIAVEHDVRLAWHAGAKWILCDDARDAEVCRGIFNALHSLNRGDVNWAYFPEGAGNILIRTDHRREK
jgi:hypothetical protein